MLKYIENDEYSIHKKKKNDSEYRDLAYNVRTTYMYIDSEFCTLHSIK